MKSRVVVSLDASFVSEFTDFTLTELTAALKKLGFADVSETAIGADMVTARLASDLEQAETVPVQGRRLFLSSHCPAAVEFIKRYMSAYAPYLTDYASPLLAHARFLHRLYGEDVGVVYIGTCIARKRESDTWSDIDAAITFKELRQWFSKEGIVGAQDSSASGGCGWPEKTSGSTAAGAKFPLVPFRAASGELYAIEGGLSECLKNYGSLKSTKRMVISGIENIRQTLRGFNPDNLDEPLYIELNSCAGGCINGPGTTRPLALAHKRLRTIHFAQTAGQVLDTELVQGMLRGDLDLKGILPGEPVVRKLFSEQEVQKALRSIGKYTVADLINCNGCGYDTCRQFAQAMLDGVAEKNMCVAYMRNLAQKKANALIQAIPSGVVIADKNLNIIECNRNFAGLMGSKIVELFDAQPGLAGTDLTTVSQHAGFFSDVLLPDGPDVIDREVHEGKRIMHYTVFVIEDEEIAAGVIEDITTPQNQKKRTISQARKVIEKNLSVVQKIAFLLGENAAETESMLNSIIDSYGDEDL